MNAIGKFYWILDDFKYIGSRNEETEHHVANIDSFVADDNMIRLTTKAINFNGGEEIGYSINLIRKDNIFYSGEFRILTMPDVRGRVTGQLFENQHKYFLYGNWEDISDDDSPLFYTWFAHFEKHRK